MSEQTTTDVPVATAIAASLRAGDRARAADLASALVAQTLGAPVTSVQFTNDAYSLNSVSGLATLDDDLVRFFKFHTEEGEQHSVTEYYRAKLLADAGLPVDVPIAMSALPGSQLAVYAQRTDQRMADVCLEIERSDGPVAALPAALLAARRELDRATAAVMLSTLRASGDGDGATLHQLFGRRLADEGHYPGGRYRRWYVENPAWSGVSGLHWRVNGVRYAATLQETCDAAATLLDPTGFAAEPVVVGHGDDHHGNVWVSRDGGTATLVLFDPAFAGSDLPALLAPVKATFHNALAHPFWLYHPDEAARRTPPGVEISAGVIDVQVETDLSPLRQAVLDSARDEIWIPLLTALQRNGWLRPTWRRTLRAAFFACPMLVTNLMAQERPEAARWIGLAHAVMAGSEPVDGSDAVSTLLDDLGHALSEPA